MALWYLFDSTTREVGSINIVLGFSLLEAISKRVGEKNALFDYFDKS